MANARSVIVRDSTGALATGLTPTSTAYSRDGVAQTVAWSEKANSPGEYQIEPTDAHEDLGVIVVLEFPAGYLPRSRCFEVFKGDNSNQFWAADVRAVDGSRWSGASPSVGAYTWEDGTNRVGSAPATVAVPAGSTWLFCWTPSAEDIANDASIRVDGPAGSLQPWWYSDVRQVQNVAPVVPVYSGTSQQPEAVATVALVEWLRAQLPAKCVELNAAQRASLTAAVAGPYTFGANGSMKVSAVGSNDSGSPVAITAATYTAAQLASTINTAAPSNIAASVDYAGRLVLTSTVAPAEDAPSVVALLSDEDTGVNAVLGWEAGGELSEVEALVSPGFRNVMDGDWLHAPDPGRGFIVAVLGRRASSVPGSRDTLFLVDVDVAVDRPFGTNVTPHRNRTAIEACLRAVRECITNTSKGRQLGRDAQGDVQKVDIVRSGVEGEAFTKNGVTFEAAALQLRIRVFQPPTGN